LTNDPKKGWITPKLISSNHPALRRLFYDFSNQFKTKDLGSTNHPKLYKKDYLKFIESFVPYKRAVEKKYFITDTNSKKQTLTIKNITSLKINPRQKLE
jgi:hypothetical protein